MESPKLKLFLPFTFTLSAIGFISFFFDVIPFISKVILALICIIIGMIYAIQDYKKQTEALYSTYENLRTEHDKQTKDHNHLASLFDARVEKIKRYEYSVSTIKQFLITCLTKNSELELNQIRILHNVLSDLEINIIDGGQDRERTI